MSVFGWSLPAGCGTLPGEETGAYEEKIDGVWWAWDEDDRIFRHNPSNPNSRDDGYVYIGQMVWPADTGPEFDSRVLLREFVRNYKE